MAMIAPAPAQTPSIAATIGCGQARIALTTSPVILVKSSSSAVLILVSGSMISNTSPPEQKLPPAPVTTMALTLLVLRRGAEQVDDLGVAVEGQRVLLVRPVERQRRDLAVDREAHVARLVAGQRQRDRIGGAHRRASVVERLARRRLGLGQQPHQRRDVAPATGRRKSRRSSRHSRAPWRGRSAGPRRSG